jgi:hypothetical protein
MPNNTIPVNVNINFNGVTYNAANGTWSGTPNWNPQPMTAPVRPVQSGSNNTVQWKLNAASVPNPFSAAFASASAIAFSGTPAWTGGAPVLVDGQTITAADNFDNLPQTQTYYYSITVTLTGTVNGSPVTQPFTLDPDVQNEAGTALTHTTR